MFYVDGRITKAERNRLVTLYLIGFSIKHYSAEELLTQSGQDRYRGWYWKSPAGSWQGSYKTRREAARSMLGYANNMGL